VCVGVLFWLEIIIVIIIVPARPVTVRRGRADAGRRQDSMMMMIFDALGTENTLVVAAAEESRRSVRLAPLPRRSGPQEGLSCPMTSPKVDNKS
jgi:hypothetical protein